MADTLETRLLEAQSERQAPIDTVSALVGDELVRRQGSTPRQTHQGGPLPRCEPLCLPKTSSSLCTSGIIEDLAAAC